MKLDTKIKDIIKATSQITFFFYERKQLNHNNTYDFSEHTT